MNMTLKTPPRFPTCTLVGLLKETTNLAIRTGDTVRFIANAECRQALRVGLRDGMVFPPHRTTPGLLLWPS